MNTRVVIVAVYFGELPENLQLWLDSCAWNPDFRWLLVCDADLRPYLVPPNVVTHSSSLAEVRAVFSRHAGFEVCLDRPYKLCDFKPLYWLLLEELGIAYDFWGFCDLDVIFGRLESFIDDHLLQRHDRVLELGHLSLFRNCLVANQSYRLVPGARWRYVFSNPAIFGFDEHSGINTAWQRRPMRFLRGAGWVADLAPEFAGLRLTVPRANRVFQRFLVRDGRVLRESWSIFRGRVEDEFLYVHFQKRALRTPTLPRTPDLTIHIQPEALSLSESQSLTSCLRYWCEDLPAILRSWARAFKRSLRLALNRSAS